MEVPDPRSVYNGAQRSGAVVSDSEGTTSILQIVPDTEDEATMPDPSTEVAMPSFTMADRQCPYHLNLEDTDIRDEVSRQSIEVNVVIRSCATGRSEIMRSEVITNECKRVPATAQ